MPSAYYTSLITARDAIASQLATLATSSQASYSLDGKSVSRSEYFKSLTQQLKDINELIQQADGEGGQPSPVWLTTQGVP